MTDLLSALTEVFIQNKFVLKIIRNLLFRGSDVMLFWLPSSGRMGALQVRSGKAKGTTPPHLLPSPIKCLAKTNVAPDPSHPVLNCRPQTGTSAAISKPEIEVRSLCVLASFFSSKCKKNYCNLGFDDNDSHRKKKMLNLPPLC